MSVDRLEATPIPDVNEDAIETVGWPELVRTVAAVYAALPPSERATAVVFAGNYGEAGAIDRFGGSSVCRAPTRVTTATRGSASRRIPQRRSSCSGYRDPSGGFLGCRPAATIDNGVELENEEQGGTVFVCLRPRGSWSQAWPRLAHPDA